jgi:N4-gp56 family major capsid protein
MADFTTNMTSTASIDDSIILAYDQQFLITVGQENVMDNLVQKRVEIGAKSIQMTKYSRLGLATTPLTETEDLTSESLSDTQILLTPQEYGNVVTKTSLASLQSGGKIDLAIPQLIGINAASTMDKLAILALDAASNTYIVEGTAAGSVAATQVADRKFFNYFYNKLARKNVATFQGGFYAAVLHDDVIADIRENDASGSWIDVSKYAATTELLTNEVGVFCGFKIIRNNHATFGDQTGSGTVDLYNCYFMGNNALGKATSKPVGLTFTGPFDKLGRFVNIGWYTATQYKIIDTDAVWLGRVASSKGLNSA